MSEVALNTADNIKLQTMADEIAKKYGRQAYAQLCKKWGISSDEQTENIAVAMFSSGAHTGITELLEALPIHCNELLIALL